MCRMHFHVSLSISYTLYYTHSLALSHTLSHIHSHTHQVESQLAEGGFSRVFLCKDVNTHQVCSAV
jgi:hypothetical protein